MWMPMGLFGGFDGCRGDLYRERCSLAVCECHDNTVLPNPLLDGSTQHWRCCGDRCQQVPQRPHGSIPMVAGWYQGCPGAQVALSSSSPCNVPGSLAQGWGCSSSHVGRRATSRAALLDVLSPIPAGGAHWDHIPKEDGDGAVCGRALKKTNARYDLL